MMVSCMSSFVRMVCVGASLLMCHGLWAVGPGDEVPRDEPRGTLCAPYAQDQACEGEALLPKQAGTEAEVKELRELVAALTAEVEESRQKQASIETRVDTLEADVKELRGALWLP
ncbi:hypothetical protein [Candidatus Hepatobacter penaei]|uniref:hypothetical protein n=1 Tax=Candidatus Hepatobacter penaei TaxID=1274402 RepID=UPI0012E020C6|nr:hypothetical protein [Candidatus Hepatobacter penaei]